MKTDRSRLGLLARRVVARLRKAGYIAFFAGGCVRDLLLDIRPRDYDIATNADADSIAALFPGSSLVGRSFGVVKVPLGGIQFDVAAFRTEFGYKDGRHPSKVLPTDPQTDARRRDFTVNSLYYDPVRKEILDFTGGVNDCKNRLLRCVGDPSEKFQEDHLRILRAVRLAAVLEFKIHRRTSTAMRRMAPLVRSISPERIKDELARMLLDPACPGRAVNMLDRFGILQHLIPELYRHDNSLKRRRRAAGLAARMLDIKGDLNLNIALAILLHSSGTAAARILKRFRFSRHTVKHVSRCVTNQAAFAAVHAAGTAASKYALSSSTVTDELELLRRKLTAEHKSLRSYSRVLSLLGGRKKPLHLEKPWITGRDMLKLGFKPGPLIGKLLRESYHQQLAGKCASRREIIETIKKRHRP